MKDSKRVQAATLTAAFAIIIVIGATILLRNPQDDKPPPINNLEEGNTLNSSDGVEMRYQEELLFEEPWKRITSNGYFIGNDTPMIAFDNVWYNMTTKEQIKTKAKLSYTPSALLVNDDLSFLSIRLDQDTQKVYYEKYDKKGKLDGDPVELQGYAGEILTDAETPRIVISRLRATEDYLYVLEDLTMQVFHWDGTLQMTCSSRVRDFDIDEEGNLYLCLFRGFQKINVETGGEAFKTDLGVLSWGIQYKDKSFYVVTNQGIAKYNSETGAWKADDLSFARDTSIVKISPIRGCWRDEDGVIYISYGLNENGNELNRVYKYSLQPYTPPKIETTLVLAAPYRDDFMEEAILRYQRKHPEIEIDYQYEFNTKLEYDRIYGMVAYGGDYAQQLALKIMTGDAGDIVQTGGSGLAYRDLFLTDAFLDVKDRIQKDKSYGDINQSAIEALEIEGAIRGVPISTSSLFIEANRQLGDTLGVKIDYQNLSWGDVLDLYDIWKEVYPDRPFISVPAYGSGASLHIRSFLMCNLPDLIDPVEKKVDLREEWFLNMLERWKNNLKDTNFILPFKSTDSYLNWLKGGLFRQGSTNEAPYQDMLDWYGMFNQLDTVDTVYIPPFQGEQNRNRIAYSTDLYSITNKSEHKEEAWDFLSYLIQSDVQSYKSYNKNYINLQVRDEKFDELAYTANDFGYGIKTEEFFSSMRELQDNLDFLYDLDYYITDVFLPIQEYFNDKLTLDEAITQAEQSIWIRMNE